MYPMVCDTEEPLYITQRSDDVIYHGIITLMLVFVVVYFTVLCSEDMRSDDVIMQIQWNYSLNILIFDL